MTADNGAADPQAELDEINGILRKLGIDEPGARGLRKLAARLEEAEGWSPPGPFDEEGT